MTDVDDTLASSISTSTLGLDWIFQGEPCPGKTYCVNGARCIFFPRLNSRACSCSVGFEGSRCEYSTSDHETDFKHSHQSVDRACSGFESYVYLTNALMIVSLCIVIFMLSRFLKVNIRSSAIIKRIESGNEPLLDMDVEKCTKQNRYPKLAGEESTNRQFRHLFRRLSVKQTLSLPPEYARTTSDPSGAGKESKWTVVKERLLS